MAMGNFVVSDLCDDGTCAGILYYLEIDSSGAKMVGT
jgi:hypothetical protein